MGVGLGWGGVGYGGAELGACFAFLYRLPIPSPFQVACIGFSPNHTCGRCTRLKLHCIAAPNATGKQKESSTQGIIVANVAAHVQPRFRTPSIYMDRLLFKRMVTEASIVDIVMEGRMERGEGFDSLGKLLRSWMFISRARNAYELMTYAVFLCQKAGIPLVNVMPKGDFATSHLTLP